MKTFLHRPFKFGTKNRRISVIHDSEVAFRAINDKNGNPVYIGKAIIGTLESEPKWQLRKMTYDSNQGIIKVSWAINTEGEASSDFEFIWTNVENYQYL